MTEVRAITINTNDSETRTTLESLHREMERLKSINANSEDDDEAADAGNDYMEVSSLYDKLVDVAVGQFGEQITDFTSEYL